MKKPLDADGLHQALMDSDSFTLAEVRDSVTHEQAVAFIREWMADTRSYAGDHVVDEVVKKIREA